MRYDVEKENIKVVTTLSHEKNEGHSRIVSYNHYIFDEEIPSELKDWLDTSFSTL